VDSTLAAEVERMVAADGWQGVVLACDGEHQVMVMSPEGTEFTEAAMRGDMRALIEEAVGRVAPEEIGNIEEMMVQFEGREEELLQALEAMGRGVDSAGGKRKVVSDGNTARSLGSARSFRSEIQVQPPDAGNGGVRGLFGFDWMKHKDASEKILKELESHQFPKKEVGAVERALVVEDNNSPQNELDNRDGVDTSAYLTAMSDDSSKKLKITSEASELSELTTEPKSSMTTQRLAEINKLIEKEDWKGIVSLANKYKKIDSEDSFLPDTETNRTPCKHQPDTGGTPSKPPAGFRSYSENGTSHSLSTLNSSFSDPEDGSQNDSSSLEEELNALQQAEVWATIAAQGKLRAGAADISGASDAMDWAFSRRLKALESEDSIEVSTCMI